jgi:hypothetical protein
MLHGSRIALLTLPVVALALGGCATEAPSASSPTPVYPTDTASATSTPTPTPGAKDPNAPQGQCDDDALKVSVAPAAGGGAAGSIGYEVTFTNTGSASCVLDGYPGVSVVGHGDGTQLGPAADRVGDSPKPVQLAAAGGSVSAPLRVTNIGKDGGPLTGCDVVGGDGWRVYPPHSYRAFFVQDSSITACQNGPVWMHLTAGVQQTN